MTEHYDVAVIGGGIVGLAVARAFCKKGQSVVVLEVEEHLGMHSSGRGSGVIHAGIYHKQHTLKAQLCVRGRELLYDYCLRNSIPNYRLGKFIVSPTRDGEDVLRALCVRGHDNKVDDLQLIGSDIARRMEPNLRTRCDYVIWSPSTGVVSVLDYFKALSNDVTTNGGKIVTSFEVTHLKSYANGSFTIVGNKQSKITATRVVNAAGTQAAAVAMLIDDLAKEYVYDCDYIRGQYYVYNAPNPFNRLIYPLPVSGGGGLGIHTTISVYGRVAFGPDATYVEGINYDKPPSIIPSYFIESIRSYYPNLDPGKLVPGWVGVRPHLRQGDFRIDGPSVHGMSGLVNLFGIESPGLTASLAIAEEVVQRLES